MIIEAVPKSPAGKILRRLLNDTKGHLVHVVSSFSPGDGLALTFPCARSTRTRFVRSFSFFLCLLSQYTVVLYLAFPVFQDHALGGKYL